MKTSTSPLLTLPGAAPAVGKASTAHLTLAAALLAVATYCSSSVGLQAQALDPRETADNFQHPRQGPDGAGTDRYIVKLRTDAFDNVGPEQHDKVLARIAADYGIAPKHVYSTVMKGFAGHISPGLLARLQNDPLVESVTPDLEVTAFGEVVPQVVPNGVARIGAIPVSGGYTGDGVGVAVVDTGLDFNHVDLAPAVPQYWSPAVVTVSSAQDDNGHGTHVGGIIAALDNDMDVVGVAPNATLYAVKVLNSLGSGYDSDIIGGLNWVAKNAARVVPPIRVVNMSLGRAASSNRALDEPMHTAIKSLVKLGITVVVAAGNAPTLEVKDVVPSGFPEVIAVASTTALAGTSDNAAYATVPADTASYFTTDGALNPSTGVGVTISAPGEDEEDIVGGVAHAVGILSLKLGGGTTRMAGTSMASPHVAGVVALLYEANSSLTPANAKFKVAAGELEGVAPLDSKTTTYTYDGVKEGILNVTSAFAAVPPPPDFSLSASPSSRTVKRGSSTTYTVTVTPSGGFTGTVGFSVSGLPSGSTGTFSPRSVTTSGSSSLKITTKSSTPRGTYPLTITGTGSLVDITTVSLTVN